MCEVMAYVCGSCGARLYALFATIQRFGLVRCMCGGTWHKAAGAVVPQEIQECFEIRFGELAQGGI